MNIQECFDFINFWVNKNSGSFFSINELTELVDRGSLAYFADMQSKASTSQRIKDALSPFRKVYEFGYPNSIDGIVTVPTNQNFINLLDLSIRYDISARSIVREVPIAMMNEDERGYRLNSQVEPVTAMSPVGEEVGLGQFQLYPKVQYRGRVTFYRRPVKPVFAYTVISGRVIVYDPANSVQLEWPETHIVAVLLKGLSSIGINLGDADVLQYSQLKTQENFQNVNRL